MKILLASVQVPFIRGGAEVLAEMLQSNLRLRGHQVDTVTIPFKWYPSETLMASMVAGRLLDLEEVNGEKVDLLIGLKFPAYYARHSRKVLWLLHQHRQAYDLWGTQFGDIHTWPDGEFVRKTVFENDSRYLAEARAIYTISQNVSDRLQKYNGLESEPLYHPPSSHEKLGSRAWEPFIFYPSRVDRMKRQRLLVEAARHLQSDASIVIAGRGSESETRLLNEMISRHGLRSRVQLLGYIGEDRKTDLLSRCCGVFFGAYDEDYGYVTLEAMFSEKPVLALSDTGGALEFVRNGYNGYVVEPDAKAVAQRIDELARCDENARLLGRRGRETMSEKRVSWDYVIDRLLEPCRA